MEPADFDLYRALMSPDELPDFSLEELLHRPEWHERAACRGMGADMFFPARGEKVDGPKAVCTGCPVRAECLDFALGEDSSLAGVWAGTSARQRRTMVRVRRSRQIYGAPGPRATFVCEHCRDDAGGSRTGLCKQCRHYRWRYGRLPGPDALATRAERRRQRAS